MGAPIDIRPPALSPAPALSNARDLQARAAGDEAKIKKVATDFEAMVLGQMLQPMFEALDSDGLFGGGSAERMFRPMLVEEYAKSLAATGGLGFAEPIAREIIRLQTEASATPEAA